MIIHAVSHLMKVAEMRRFYQLRCRDFWLGMITLLGVIVLDVLPGLLIGVVLSILVLAFMASSEAVEKLADVLGRQRVRLVLAHVHAPAMDMLSHFEPAEGAGVQDGWRAFPTLDSAVSWARRSIQADDAPEAQVGG